MFESPTPQPLVSCPRLPATDNPWTASPHHQGVGGKCLCKYLIGCSMAVLIMRVCLFLSLLCSLPQHHWLCPRAILSSSHWYIARRTSLLLLLTPVPLLSPNTTATTTVCLDCYCCCSTTSRNSTFQDNFLWFWMTFLFRISPHPGSLFSPVPSNLVLCLSFSPFNFHTRAASVKTDYCYGFHYSCCCYPSWRQSCFQKKLSLLSVFIWSSRAMWNRWTVQRQPCNDYTG